MMMKWSNSFYWSDGDESASDGDLNSHSHGDDRAIAVQSLPANANHLLLVALLEYVCSLHVTNRRKRDKLFKVLSARLAQMKIMSPVVAMEELSSVRMQYRQSFATLLHASVTSLKMDCHLALPGSQTPVMQKSYNGCRFLDQPNMNLSHMIGFHTSRYGNEYEQVKTLGKGAYGSVYKVRHKLDGSMYAVKVVAFQHETPDLWNKTLREVKHLADLTHSSVIRYYTAWLEYQLPNLVKVDNEQKHKTRDDCYLPALTYYQEAQDESSSSNPDPSGSSSVMFEESRSRSRPPRRYHRTNSWELSGPDGTKSDWCNNVDESEPEPEISMASSSENLLVENSYVALYIQMELCCETLQDWLRTRNNKLTSSLEVYHIVDEDMNQYIVHKVLQGIHYLHSLNLIHRDLKPSNIFLNHKPDDAMEVKIGDFGLARQTHTKPNTERSTSVPETPPMTPAPGIHTDHMLDINGLLLTTGVGTTIYASPEQLAGVDYGEKSDMYSLGLIQLELYQPFCTAMERSKILTDARKGILPPEFIEKWPVLSETISQLLDLDPEKRPSATELLEGKLFHTDQEVIELLRQSLRQKNSELFKRDLKIKEQDLQIQKLQKDLAEKDEELRKLRQLLKPPSDWDS